MYDLSTIGDIKLDTFIQIPKASVLCKYKDTSCELCIAHGKKIPVDQIESQIAGSAPNVGIALSRMGKKSTVISVMGKDATYRQTLDFLKAENVSVKYIKAKPGEQSSFSAVLNYEGESTQLVAHTHLEIELPSKFPKTRWLHLSELGNNYKSLFREIMALTKKNDIKLSFNPGAVQVEAGDKVLFQLIKVTELLIVNRLEANQLLGLENASMEDLIVGIQKLGAKINIITDGKHGAYAVHDGARWFAEMFPGERVEATGAGDAFASGCLGAILHGLDVRDALAWGSVNAASVVGLIGPTAGLLSQTEIQEKLSKNNKYKVVNF
jgi:sugar/nucleoside kinase (ribokinase family)